MPSQSELSGSSEIDCAAMEATKRSITDANFILKIFLGSWGYARSELAKRVSSRGRSFKDVSGGIYTTWKGTSLSISRVQIVVSPITYAYILIDHL